MSPGDALEYILSALHTIRYVLIATFVLVFIATASKTEDRLKEHAKRLEKLEQLEWEHRISHIRK